MNHPPDIHARLTRAMRLLVERMAQAPHPNPATALSDGHQALLPTQLHDIVKGLRRVAEAVGRTL